MRSIGKIIVHTAASQARNVDAELIRRWHVHERGWNDIGYHWVIVNHKHDTFPDGMLQQGRTENLTGAHAAGANVDSIGVCIIGHGDHEPPTPAQYATLIPLLRSLCARYGLTADDIYGHRDFTDQKTCPGTQVSVDDIRRLVGS